MTFVRNTSLILVLLVIGGCATGHDTGKKVSDAGDLETKKVGPLQPATSTEVRGDKTVVESTTQCSIPALLPVSRDNSVGVPRFASASGINSSAQNMALTLRANGRIEVFVEVELQNPSNTDVAEVVIGYSWRIPRYRDASNLPLFKLETENNNDLRECAVSGPANIQEPFSDVARWLEVSVGPGETATVGFGYEVQSRELAGPGTLFGYPDRFALNLKNMPWSYLSDSTKKKTIGEIKPFFSSFDLHSAETTRIVVRTAGGEDWFRALSHEQNVTKERTPGTYTWNFAGGSRPPSVSLSYLPGLSIAREIALFEELVRTHSKDLRTHIRLSDLYRFGGSAKQRARVLKHVEKKWESVAKQQLLAGRNDLRAAAYVGLVRSLKDSGESKDSLKMAERALKTIRTISKRESPGAESINSLCRTWLEGVVSSPEN
jgi:hypothetical protein